MLEVFGMGRRTAAVCDVRHLAARDHGALRILNELRARQRGRLRIRIHPVPFFLVPSPNILSFRTAVQVRREAEYRRI